MGRTLTLEAIDGGYRIKENDAGTHYIDVLTMIVNFRVVRTPKRSPQEYDRAFCYQGTDHAAFWRACLAAAAWDGADDTAPEGWVKNALTGERRNPSDADL